MGNSNKTGGGTGSNQYAVRGTAKPKTPTNTPTPTTSLKSQIEAPTQKHPNPIPASLIDTRLGQMIKGLNNTGISYTIEPGRSTSIPQNGTCTVVVDCEDSYLKSITDRSAISLAFIKGRPDTFSDNFHVADRLMHPDPSKIRRSTKDTVTAADIVGGVPVWHMTTETNADIIKDQGFNIEKAQRARSCDYGVGVYFYLSREDLESVQARAAAYVPLPHERVRPLATAMISAEISTRSPLEVTLVENDYTDLQREGIIPVEPDERYSNAGILAKAAGLKPVFTQPNKRYDSWIHEQNKNVSRSAQERWDQDGWLSSDDLQATVQSAGYDSLIIHADTAPYMAGGSQLVVYDPSLIHIAGP